MNLDQKILSDVTVFMKYAKHLPALERRETWEEIVERNKQMHLKKFPAFQEGIEQAYSYVFEKKVLPSMRSLQFAGRPIEINESRIYNCAFAPVDSIEVFSEIMFLLLGGTGVGFSVQSNHVEKLPEVQKPFKRKRKYVVGDSIEGWADAIKVLMKSYFGVNKYEVDFDFSDIRAKGSLLVTSGGKAPGPEPLIRCVNQIKLILDRKENGTKLSTLECHDIICHIADAVLAGGIRRAALISLFDHDDEDMLYCKFGAWYENNPQRGRSNNSAVLVRHKASKEVFLDIWKKVEGSKSGEPGIYFTNNAEWGTNPCCEIALRPYQFCNLVEINGNNIESFEDYMDRIRAATTIATLQASYTDFHYLRDVWRETTEKDALVGVGITGIASQSINPAWLEAGADYVKKINKDVAKTIGIKPAARTTTVKPSGTASIVVGGSSGIHAWHDKYYIRRIRVGKNESIYTYLYINHPELLEDDVFNPAGAIISVPQKAPEEALLRGESAIDFLERVKQYNIGWVRNGHRKGDNTNNVSATVSVKDDEWNEVGEWMWENKDYYNGLSVLPYDGGSYIQAPFESITEEKYNEMIGTLHTIDLTKVIELTDNTDLTGELACGPEGCEVK